MVQNKDTVEPFKMESLPVEITHIRFLAFIGVYLFTVIFYIECFKIVDLEICVMYQSTPKCGLPMGLVPENWELSLPYGFVFNYQSLPSEAADLSQNFFNAKRQSSLSSF